jgi:hypothetical protein
MVNLQQVLCTLLIQTKWTLFLKITVDMIKKNSIKKYQSQTFNILRLTQLVNDNNFLFFGFAII